MRCLALAQAWQAAGGRAIFLSSCESQLVRSRIEADGIGFIPLDGAHPNPTDFRRTAALLKEVAADWLVIDGYHFDPMYQKAFCESGQRLLVVDDFAHWPEYHADILLNQNIGAPGLGYRQNGKTTFLLGTPFVLLRREFQVVRKRQRKIPRIGRRVLITLGGGDPDNITLTAVRALGHTRVDDLEAIVVIGGSNPNFDTLRSNIESFGKNVRLVHDTAEMPDLMSWADAAVSGGGSTCWELAFMGLPGVIIVIAENQVGIAKGLGEAGSAINLGWFHCLSEQEVGHALSELLVSCDLRRRMSLAGRALVDGMGAARVIGAMGDRQVCAFSAL